MFRVLQRLSSQYWQLDGIMATLARGAGAAFLIQAAGMSLKYLTQVLFARWMGTVEYGMYAYAFTWAKLLALLAGMGFTTSVLRFVPQYLASHDWGRLRGVIRRSQQLTLVSGIVLSGLGALLLLSFHQEEGAARALLAGLVLVPLLALVNLQMEITRGMQYIALAYAPPMVVHPLLSVAAAFLIFRATDTLTGVAVLGAVAAGLSLVLAMQAWGLGRTQPKETSCVRAIYETVEWLRVSFPLLAIALFLVVLNQADIIVLGMFLGPKAAGIYTAATRTAALVSFFLVAVNAIAAPMISSLHSTGDRLGLQRMVRVAAQWMVWPSLAATLVLVLFGEPILGIFGPEFTQGRWAVALLALGQLVNAGVGPVGYLMSLTGHQGLSARVHGLSALINVVLNAVLVPLWGLIGAALATTATMVLWNVWLYILVRKLLGVDPVAFSIIGKKGRGCE